jgi:acetyl-CoA C-acetyltransferase
MAETAAEEHYAWFRRARSAAEIRTAHAGNRMAVHPYTKLMCAMMGVRQAAALLVVDERVADRFGVPQERRVYLTTASEGHNPWFVSEREHLATSLGLERALERAWDSSGLNPEAVDLWDLYSCFPVATQLASDVLARPPDSQVTLIGGLPYFGGPGNHYSLHALCNAVQRLRAEPDKTAVIEALSWYMSKFAVAVLSGVRPAKPFAFRRADPGEAEGQCAVRERADGRVEIESYTLLYDREDRPLRAVLVGRDDDRRRCLAVTHSDAALIETIRRTDPIGGTARVAHRAHDGLNHILDIE